MSRGIPLWKKLSVVDTMVNRVWDVVYQIARDIASFRLGPALSSLITIAIITAHTDFLQLECDNGTVSLLCW
jgi:hypothetical protein